LESAILENGFFTPKDFERGALYSLVETDMGSIYRELTVSRKPLRPARCLIPSRVAELKRQRHSGDVFI